MNSTHSIMFHHFHDEKHLPAQGSLSSDDFSSMLDWLCDRYNLLGAKKYLEKFESSLLDQRDICLSFDDALLCQYDIAIPILEQRGIDAFFFIYSSVFTGAPDKLEIFRYFRTNAFTNIDDFYSLFFELVTNKYHKEVEKHAEFYSGLNYLKAFPFYSEDDKWFRYLRDQVLGVERYEQVMVQLMNAKGFSPSGVIDDLWMTEAHLKNIDSLGHLVGLHSFSHPTQMSALSYENQQKEYQMNLEHLRGVVGEVVCMSHPCGDYNDDTLNILEGLGIRIGFRSSLVGSTARSKFEIPRDDHANVYKAMKK